MASLLLLTLQRPYSTAQDIRDTGAALAQEPVSLPLLPKSGRTD